MESMFRIFLIVLLAFFAWILWILMRAGEENRRASVSHHHDGPMDSSATDVSASEPLTATSSVATSESEEAAACDPIDDETSDSASATSEIEETPIRSMGVGDETSHEASESMATPSTADSSAAHTPAADEVSPATPSASGPDELTRIKGIGRVLELKLNDLGITTFQQIAEFTPEDIERVNDRLPFKGRIERDSWIEQAKGIVGQQR